MKITARGRRVVAEENGLTVEMGIDPSASILGPARRAIEPTLRKMMDAKRAEHAQTKEQ